MDAIKQWLETDESKKDLAWAGSVLRTIRWYGVPLVDAGDKRLGMDYLFARQDMSNVRKLFLNPALLLDEKTANSYESRTSPPNGQRDNALVWEMQDMDFRPIPLLEPMRNTLTAENKTMGILANIMAVDPTSAEERKNDKSVLNNKKFIEGLLSYVYANQGDQPVKLDKFEARHGIAPFKGNITQMDELGLDASNPQDVSFFMSHFHKLPHEIAAQQCIDTIMKDNDVVNKIDLWVNDALSAKTVVVKTFVSEKNGAIVHEYVAPENVQIYGSTGRYKTFLDANAICYQQTVTVAEFLELIGDEFDFETYWNQLVMSIFFYNQVQITGINPGSMGIVSYPTFTGWNGSPLNTRTYSYTDFMQFKVCIGYAEWRSQNLNKAVERVGEIAGMELTYEGKAPSQQSDPKTRYSKEARYEQPIYKCYFMPLSTIEQIIFKFGKLDYQNIEGYNDTQCFGSFKMWKEPGQPLSLLCAKRIDLYNEAFYKFVYEMRRAKPKGRMWNYEAMVSIAEHMIADTGKGDVADKVGKIMEMNAKSANEIYGFVVENGVKRFIPAKELAVDLENGVPDSAMRYIEIMREQLESIKDEMGIAPLREADPGQNRTPASVSMTALEYSQKATAYIPDMITWIIDAAAGNSLLWVQDIVTFGDKDTLAYNYLKNLVGQECLDNMGQLGKQSIRRFGIYITNVNSTKQKQDLDMVLQAAVQNKSITTSQLLLVKSIQDPKKAFLTLAYLEQKNIRDTQTAQQQQAQAQQQHEMQMLQMQLADKQKERDAMLEGKKIDYDAAIGSHTITQQGGIAKTAMKVQADADNIARQAESDMQTKFNQNTPNPPIPPFPQIPGAQNPMGGMQGMQQPQQQPAQQPQIPPTLPPGSMG